ncbi:carbohydrate kinase [Actinomycetospora sp. TBRC 11914]|uniref:carbohydrate kinase family protein n=1 Tax=Actinomycetospora sp. TBRC 11914 TaxID=2729387 RepID=UPI00145D957E|nr:carbohydrate kinase [Actinomycetospora sp. TBRC 11914]NMO92462.1 carbohydrate kinase [Actinomycetospora sp. TBRC 11914]
MTASRRRVVVGGEALVDLVPVDQGPLAPLAPRLGGGPYNVAIGLGRLGTPARMLTRLSRDAFGDALLDRLRDSAVDVALVQRGDEPSTLAVVTLDGSGAARYSFHVAGAADRLVADPGELPADTAALAVGTLSLLLEPGASVYTGLARRAADAGVFVSLDPNIRPALVDDPDVVRARLDAIAARAGLVKLSDEDAAWWGRSPADLIAAGAGAVVVTRGAEGLVAHTRRGAVAVAADTSRPVVDTIGAGDSVHSALLAHLHAHDLLAADRLAALDDDGWRAALGFAARVASWTVSRAGAEPPTRAELDGEGASG